MKVLRYSLLMFLLVIPGLLGCAVFGYFALVDWDALQKAYGYFDRIAQANAGMEALFVAEARQNIHRINLFAEGIWFLLSAVIASIGLHGLCTVVPKRQR